MNAIKDLAQQLEVQLKAFEEEIKDLSERAELSDRKIQEEIHIHSEKLMSHRDEIAKNLLYLRTKGNELWQELEERIELARKDLEETIRETQSKFK